LRGSLKPCDPRHSEPSTPCLYSTQILGLANCSTADAGDTLRLKNVALGIYKNQAEISPVAKCSVDKFSL